VKRASEFLSFASTPVAPTISPFFSLPLPRLSLFLICLSVTFSHVSPSSATVFLRLALTFSFSRRAANRAQTSLTIAVANAAAQRSAALHVVAFVRNFYAPLLSSYLSPFLVFSLSLFLSQRTPQVTSNSPLHHARGCCRAHITSSTPSLLSRCPSATTRSLVVPRPVFVPQRAVTDLKSASISVVSFAIVT